MNMGKTKIMESGINLVVLQGLIQTSVCVCVLLCFFFYCVFWGRGTNFSILEWLGRLSIALFCKKKKKKS